MATISLCMIVKDEELTLERCLQCAKGFADEIIVVDTGSADRTKEIAEKYETEFSSPDFYLENELFRLYEEALRKLPAEFRQAYEMNRSLQMTHKEIAEKLNVSPQTINYRIGQALKILRSELKDYLPLIMLFLFLQGHK